ncbi:LysR family transcriptional regulator, partial [Lacticaseibacillus rhamnosus]
MAATLALVATFFAPVKNDTQRWLTFGKFSVQPSEFAKLVAVLFTAALLDAIARSGSISAAGRLLGMSYRRTWLLVDAMNRCWAEPLVATTTGGTKGGGARVTPLGEQVRADYAAMLAR